MKKILVTLALLCMAICSYAQRDIPAGGCMEVASLESDDSIGGIGQEKQITLYKVKDDEGNPVDTVDKLKDYFRKFLEQITE